MANLRLHGYACITALIAMALAFQPMVAADDGKASSKPNIIQTCEEPMILTDLTRAIGGLVGYELPDNAAEDSFDIGPLLLSEKHSTPIRDHLIHHAYDGMFAIRQGDWKLILGRTSGGFTRYKPPKNAPVGQLYNLAEDPAEQHNLYEQQPEIVQRLSRLLEDFVARGRNV